MVFRYTWRNEPEAFIIVMLNQARNNRAFGGGSLVTRTHQAMLVMGTLVTIGAFTAKPSEAKPPFAAKEGKPCAYCHATPSGGARNYRGLFYKAHNLTFEGFDDAAEAKKAGVEVGPDPDPATKPKTWTAPKTEEPVKAPETPAPEKPEPKKVTVAEAKAKATAAEKAYNLKKTDVKLKKNYAAALADLGEATMLDEGIAPRTRYPEALKQYRTALKLDPTNAKAKENIKLIEDVYKKMGKPVPK